MFFSRTFLMWYIVVQFKSVDNKSNATAGVLWVEANQPWTSTACTFFNSQCITRKCLTLKMKVKVTEYNIRNGSIRWQISFSIKVILEHFSLAPSIFEIFTFQNLWQRKCRLKLWCTTFAVPPFDGKYQTFYLMAIVMFAFFQRLLVKIAIWKVWPWKCRTRSA